MTELKNDRFLRALMRQPVDRTPVWMMRQAGRYLPEYRATRAKAGDFLSLCKNTPLACEVTLQPLERFPLDAAILFSDILTIPDALGLGLYFETGEGPKFRNTIRSEADVAALPKINAEVDLDYVMNAVSTIRGALNGSVPLIGFSGSPWTVGTYMVEGGSSREFSRIRGLAAEDPKALDALLAHVARTTTDYLNGQIAAGAQAIQIFDTWGGALERDDYRRFSLAPMQQILDGLTREHEGRRVPGILFTKGAGPLLADMAKSGCDALGVDWTTDLGTARKYVDDAVALQGNLDPATLRESPDAIRKGVADTLASYGRGPGHVFNLGHGVLPDFSPEKVKALVQMVHELGVRR
mgnify:CR=1 FL=1